jgi:hypothetical protein
MTDQLLHEFRQFRAEWRAQHQELVARLDALDPLHGEALLDQTLQRLAAHGLPVEFTFASMQADGVVTPAQASRLKYPMRGLLGTRSGLIGDFVVTHLRRERGAWVYCLDRVR